MYALKWVSLLEINTQHHQLPPLNAGTPLRSGFDPDCVRPMAGYKLHIRKHFQDRDWLILKGRSSFLCAREYPNHAKHLGQYNWCTTKPHLCALPSSPVNRPKGRKGMLWKQHINKDADTPFSFPPQQKGQAAAQNMDCWLCSTHGTHWNLLQLQCGALAALCSNFQALSLYNRLFWLLLNWTSLFPSPSACR